MSKQGKLITPADLEHLRAKLSAEAMSRAADPECVRNMVAEYLKFLMDNRDRMEPEATREAEAVFNSLAKAQQEAVERLPEGPEKRQLRRRTAFAAGEHHRAQDLLQVLGMPPRQDADLFACAARAFVDNLQVLVDLLFDVRRNSKRSPRTNAFLLIFHSCIEELVAAFHLAQRQFATQAFPHIRMVYEALDLVQVFLNEPKLVDLWASDDREAVIRNLSPKKVREKLGREKRDPFYSHCSVIGAHPSFDWARARSAIDAETHTQMRIWVGGAPFKHALIDVHASCLWVLSMTMLKAAEAFQGLLADDDVELWLREVGKNLASFMLSHVVPFAKEHDLDPGELERTLRKQFGVAEETPHE